MRQQSRAKARDYKTFLRLGRVSNLPTVWTNCLAAIVLAGAVPDPIGLTLISISISLLYVSGMFLNDAFDQEFDRRYRPERPIPSGEISGATVYKIGFGLMASGLVTLFAAFPKTEVVLWGTMLAALIVFYDWSHKKTAASPIIMALCRVGVYFCAAAAVGSAMGFRVVSGAAVLMAYMIGLSYVAKQENLTEIKNIWPVPLVVAPFVYAAAALQRAGGETYIYVLFLGWVIYALSHLLKKPKNIPAAVVSLIAGISLLDGVLIAMAAPRSGWPTLTIIGFLLTIAFQRYIPGT
jgi:hypothetical protein